MLAFDATLTAALGHLSAQYARAVDRRSFEDLRAVFTESGQLVVGATTRDGIEAIIATMDSLHRYETTFHNLGQLLVLDQGADRDGLWATSETYCTAHHILNTDGALADRVMFIRYSDRAVNHGRGWRLTRRLLSVDLVEDRPVSAPPPPSHGGE